CRLRWSRSARPLDPFEDEAGLVRAGRERGRHLPAGEGVADPHGVAVHLQDAVGVLARLRHDAAHPDAPGLAGGVEAERGGEELLAVLVLAGDLVGGEGDDRPQEPLLVELLAVALAADDRVRADQLPGLLLGRGSCRQRQGEGTDYRENADRYHR